MNTNIPVKLLAKDPGSKFDILFYEYNPDVGWMTSRIPTKILKDEANIEDLEQYYNDNGVFLPEDLILIDAVIQFEI